MLQCRQCGSVYDDESLYCNQCSIDFTEKNSVYVIDADEATLRYASLKKTLLLLQRFLAVLMLFFPFVVYIDYITWLHNKNEKILVTVLVEILAGVALLLSKKHLVNMRKISICLGIFLILLFPVGSLLGIACLVILMRDEWRWLK